MLKKKIVVLLAFVMSLCVACGPIEEDKLVKTDGRNKTDVNATDEEDDDDDDDKRPERKQNSDSTKCALMVYIVGSNLESELGLASRDIKEMIDSNYDEELLDIYLCTGGAKKWHNSDFKNDEIAVYKIEGDGVNKVSDLDGKSMANSSTLKAFINTCYEDTDCDCYDLVLWNHGAGAIVGFGSDENDNDLAMTLPELSDAIKGSKLIKDGNVFEIIGFDACLMGMIEVACEFEDYANYLVASEEIIPGMGWDYSFLKEIKDKDDFAGDKLGKNIIEYYADYYSNQFLFKSEYSLACLNLSKASEVKDSWEDLLEAAEKLEPQDEFMMMSRVRGITKAFGLINGEYFYDTIDLYNFASLMEGFYPDETENLKSAIDDLVVVNDSNIENSNGVAIYMPYDNKLYADYWVDIYKKIGFSEKYEEFLDGYSAFLLSDAISDWSIENTVAQEDENNVGQYYIQLTPEQQLAYTRSKALIWRKDEGIHDEYNLSICQSDTTLLDDGRLVCNFDDRVFYLTNAAGAEEPISLFEIERGKDYTIYEGTIFIFTQGDAAIWGDMVSANIDIRFDEEHPDGEIICVKEIENVEDGNLFLKRKNYEFKEGDRIQALIMSREAKFNADGTVAPFDEWTDSLISMSNTIDYDEGFGTLYKEEVEEGSFFCMFMITDVQGNVYSSGTFTPDEKIEGAYLIDEENDDYTYDNFFDRSTRTGALYDFYGNQIMFIKLPDGYVHSSSSFPKNWYVESKNGVGSLAIDGSVPDYIKEYLTDGTMPDYITDFSFEIKTKEKYGNKELWLVEEVEDGVTDVYVIIPYKNVYGDQCYAQMRSGTFEEDMTDDEIIDFVKEFIVK